MEQRFDFADRFQELARRIWLVRIPTIRAALIAGIGVGLIALASQKEYLTAFAIVPQQDLSKLRAGGLAAQLGINLAGADMAQSPDFYVDLTHSHELVGKIVDRPVPIDVIGADTTWRYLEDLLSIAGPTPAIAREETILEVTDRIRTGASLKTGVVSVGVTLPDPSASLYVSVKLLASLNAFNDSTRQTRAKAEARFLETRTREQETAVRASEDAVERFLESNRLYESSPALRFEFDRLRGELEVQRNLLSQLRQQLQQSKIESVRDTPLLTTVEPPRAAVRPVRRYIAVKTIAATLVVLIVLILAHATLLEIERGRYGPPSLVQRARRVFGLPPQS